MEYNLCDLTVRLHACLYIYISRFYLLQYFNQACALYIKLHVGKILDLNSMLYRGKGQESAFHPFFQTRYVGNCLKRRENEDIPT